MSERGYRNLTAALLTLGMAAVTTGAFYAHPALGWIVLGLCLVFWAFGSHMAANEIRASRPGGSSPTNKETAP